MTGQATLRIMSPVKLLSVTCSAEKTKGMTLGHPDFIGTMGPGDRIAGGIKGVSFIKLYCTRYIVHIKGATSPSQHIIAEIITH